MRSEKLEQAKEVVERAFEQPRNWVKPLKPAPLKCQCGTIIQPEFSEPVFFGNRVIAETGTWTSAGKCDKCLQSDFAMQQLEFEKQRIESEKQGYQERIRQSGLYPKHLTMIFANLTGKDDEATKLCKQFCKKQDFNLFLYGQSGIKKTHLVSAVANELLKTKSVKFWRTPDFLNKIRKITIEYDSAEADDWLKEIVKSNIPILLDDIGAEKVTEFVLEKFYNFFDFCELYERKGIVITSNLNLDALKKQLSDRIPSRIAGLCKIKEVKGDDWRLKR